MTPVILQQVRKRLAEPQAYQLIQEERLWGDLLSSQPMFEKLRTVGVSPPAS